MKTQTFNRSTQWPRTKSLLLFLPLCFLSLLLFKLEAAESIRIYQLTEADSISADAEIVINLSTNIGDTRRMKFGNLASNLFNGSINIPNFSGFLWFTNGTLRILTNGLTGQYLTFTNGVPQWSTLPPAGSPLALTNNDTRAITLLSSFSAAGPVAFGADNRYSWRYTSGAGAGRLFDNVNGTDPILIDAVSSVVTADRGFYSSRSNWLGPIHIVSGQAANRVAKINGGTNLVSTDMRLAESLANATDGQALVYHALSGTWTNGTVSGGSGTAETQYFFDTSQFNTNAAGRAAIKSGSVQTNNNFYGTADFWGAGIFNLSLFLPAEDPNMALVTSSVSGVESHPTVSATELGYLDGVTASIQTGLDNLVAATNALNTRVSNLNGATNGLTTRATAVETRATNLEGATNGLTTRATAVETRATNLEGATNGLTTRATAVETRATNLEGATNGLTTRATAVETRATNLEGATNGLTTRATAVETRATNLEAATNALHTRVGNTEGATNGLTTRATAVETRATNLEGATNGLTTRATAVETRATNLEGGTNGLNSAMAQTITNFNALSLSNTTMKPFVLRKNLRMFDIFGLAAGPNITLSMNESNIVIEAPASSLSDGDKGDITVSGSGATWTLDNVTVTDAKLRQSAGFSVIGRNATGTGSPADIVAGSDTVFGRNASGDLGFASLVTGQISADAVTYAKMQNISVTQRLLGRASSGAGDTEEVTTTTALDWLGSMAQGDLIYRNASAWVRLGAGSSGQFLQTLGAGANPQWATASASISGSNGDVILYQGGVPIGTNAFNFDISVPVLRISGAQGRDTIKLLDSGGGGGSNVMSHAGLRLMTNGGTKVYISADLGGAITIGGPMTAGSSFTTGTVQYAQNSLFLRGTNLWFDGQFSIYTNILSANAGGLTNIYATNILDGQYVRLWIFPSNGVTVGFPQFAGADYLDGTTVTLMTNQWNEVEIYKHGTFTNINVKTGGYAPIAGQYIEIDTNHAARTLSFRLSNSASNALFNSSNLVSQAWQTETRLIPTNNALSNITVNFAQTNIVEIWTTNNLTFTNWAGLIDGGSASVTLLIRPQLVPRGVNYGNLGLSNPGYSVAIATNANNTLWTTLTNAKTYALTITRIRTNLFPILTLWE